MQLDREVRERLDIATELRAAIERNELTLEYQAQVELATHRILGMEALVRWHHPTRGALSPTVFIPIAEQTGTIVTLGRWVFEQACRQMHAWRAEGIAPPMLAINVSLVQLRRGTEFIQDVTQTLQRWGLASTEIEFDVTERTLAQLKWTQNDVLPRLRELGFKIAIDDFGSEYSSFDYVTAYGVNHLKISRSFISKADKDAHSAATVSAIMKFAHDIGIDVIAQGVETRAQAQMLGAIGETAQAQGFHFSAAVPAEMATTLLRAGLVDPE
jgi:EAL domain-containing protein (putative c-di-GMP-specific phosphodiesterase class I)